MLGEDSARHRNQGTIKLLVQTQGLKPGIVGQNCECCTFTADTQSEVEFIESEKRFPVWSILDRWHMIQQSYHKYDRGVKETAEVRRGGGGKMGRR